MAEVKKTISEPEAQRLSGWIMQIKEQNEERSAKITKLKQEQAQLEQAVDRYNSIDHEIESLQTENRDSINLFKKLIEFAEKASGKEFIDLPMFQQE